MPSGKPQSKVLLTQAQSEAESKAIQRSGLTVSQFRRLALKNMIEQYDVEFPDDMPQHGGERQVSNEDNA